MDRVRFSDLSAPLQVLVIMGWIVGVVIVGWVYFLFAGVQELRWARRFREGVEGISQAQLLRARFWGGVGTVAGLVLAGVFLVSSGYWYSIVAICFVIVMQVADTIGSWQGWMRAKKFEELMKDDGRVVGSEKSEK